MYCRKYSLEPQWGISVNCVDPVVRHRSSKDDINLIQRMEIAHRIDAHNGCVNTICWNSSGTHILSGSDDQHLIVTNPFTGKQSVSIRSGHRANIFSAKFLPNTRDSHIVSCSGDGMIYHTDVNRPDSAHSHSFSCHQGTCYEVVTVPNDSHTFLSCGEDGTVRWFDLRTKDKCTKPDCREDVLINCRRAVTSIAVNASAPYQLAVGCADSSGRLFDRRMLGTRLTGGYMARGVTAIYGRFTPPSLEGKSHRITSLEFSDTGYEILVSYSTDYVYLFDLRNSVKPEPKESPANVDDSNDWLQGRSGSAPIKRLRVRGDWSDTGPQARPEQERREGEDAPPQANLMQRMSDMLTRWFEDRTRRGTETGDESGGPSDGPADGLDPSAASGPENPVGSPELVPDSSASTSGRTSENQTTIISDPETSTDSRSLQPMEAILSEDEVEYPENEAVGSCVKMNAPTTRENEAMTSSAMEGTSDHVIQDGLLLEKDGRRVEAVIDLEYHTHGTSNSTIKVDFADPMVATTAIATDSRSVSSHCEILSIDMDSDGSDSETGRGEDVVAMAQTGRSGDVAAGKSVESSQETVAMGSPVAREAGVVDSNRRSSPGPTVRLSPSHSEGGSVEGGRILRMRVDDLPVGASSEDDEAPSTSASPTSSSPAAMPSQPSNVLSKDRVRRLKELYRAKIEEKRKDEEYMRSVQQPQLMHTYTGHRNARTMIKEARFWGSKYIMSGSDCGHVFVWERETGKLVMLLEGDKHVVNCLQPHPLYPILATSGIDYDVKVWLPTAAEPRFDELAAEEVVRRNEVMLEETRDTITVPAGFMLRMLASLNHMYGRTRDIPRDSNDSEESSD